jgi:hypothetical protein
VKPIPVLSILVLATLGGCAEPDDVLFTRPTVPPLEIEPGLFRVTWNPGTDVVRGFTPDGGSILYATSDVPGFGAGSYVLRANLADGAVREEAAIYRRAVLYTVSHVAVAADRRLLVTWRSLGPGAVSCEECPPPPTAIDVIVRRLPPQDIVPLSAAPTRTITLPNHATNGCQHRVRIGPVEREVRARRVNPFGPVELADGSAGFLSDGETVWRYDPADTAAAPVALGPGAFPSLSPDGLRLAAAVPLGLDSTSGTCTFGLCPCVQETVTITTTGWEVVLYDLAANTSTSLAAGLEPTFDPLGDRVAVRRADALYWVDLQTGTADAIPGTEGAYAPVVAPDGSVLAFTAQRFDSPDVFFLRLR